MHNLKSKNVSQVLEPQNYIHPMPLFTPDSCSAEADTLDYNCIFLYLFLNI